MNCDEIADVLHPFADGELDLVRSLAVERHLQACPACAAAVKDLQALRGALAEPALYHRAPAGLRERVRASLRPARPTRAPARPFPHPRSRPGPAHGPPRSACSNPCRSASASVAATASTGRGRFGSAPGTKQVNR